MATVSEHLSHIKTVLSNGNPADDFQWTDQHIYWILKNLRTMLLKQKIDKGKYVSPFNFQTIPCFKLSKQKIVDCECYTTDCYALQSNCEVPRIIASDKGLYIEAVYTINNNNPTKLDYMTLDEVRLMKYSKSMKLAKGFFIHKDKVYIVGYDRLAAIKFTALFDDPVEVVSMTQECGCNEDGSALCVDPYEVEFPLDSDMSRMLHTMTYEELLKVAMMLPRDNSNDANVPSVNKKD